MPRCDTCGNDQEQAFKVVLADHAYYFDCFECAIQTLAPHCGHCGCRIIGHGMQAGGIVYCCEHCARATRNSLTPLRKVLSHENAH